MHVVPTGDVSFSAARMACMACRSVGSKLGALMSSDDAALSEGVAAELGSGMSAGSEVEVVAALRRQLLAVSAMLRLDAAM